MLGGGEGSGIAQEDERGDELKNACQMQSYLVGGDGWNMIRSPNGWAGHGTAERYGPRGL